jgi:hypothetical protein
VRLPCAGLRQSSVLYFVIAAAYTLLCLLVLAVMRRLTFFRYHYDQQGQQPQHASDAGNLTFVFNVSCVVNREP